MHRFKNILCVVNPDEKASAVVRRASELATLHGTQLSIVHVIPDAANSGPFSDDDGGVSLAKRDTGERRLLDKDGTVGNLVSKPLYGSPSEEIIRQVLNGHHDLLIKPVEGPRIRGARPSSIDKFLLRQCPCPVWIFNPARHDKHERVLGALDSDTDGANAELNDLVLDFSTSLAAEDQVEVHALSSWGVRGEEAMRSRVGTLVIRRLAAGVRRANMRWLRRLTEPYARRAAKFHVHLKKGTRNAAILNEAKKRRHDVIVMGTTGRVGVAEFLFGTLEERILSQVDCSVLAVKPKGFVSAVDA
jgi:nucleotide-binding universal stress UspA family protein